MHIPLCSSRRCTALLALGCALFTAQPARALVVGSLAATPQHWQVHGTFVQLGSSLTTNNVDYRFNDKLLPSSSASVSGDVQIPEGAKIVHARLSWGGSAQSSGADSTATFSAPDGHSEPITSTECVTVADPNPQSWGSHFLCSADVTALVNAHSGGQPNGPYSLGDVDAKVAQIQNYTAASPCGLKPDGLMPEPVCCAPADMACQARHASWSLLLVFDTDSAQTAPTDVYLSAGFMALDEQATTLGQAQVPLTFAALPQNPGAVVGWYVLEGDPQLGNPEQDPGVGGPDSPPCATCFDFIAFNGVELTGAGVEPHNAMRSLTGPGIDLMRLDASLLVQAGDTAATVLVSSGNGSLADNSIDPQVVQFGAGEFFLLAYVVVAIGPVPPGTVVEATPDAGAIDTATAEVTAKDVAAADIAAPDVAAVDVSLPETNDASTVSDVPVDASASAATTPSANSSGGCTSGSAPRLEILPLVVLGAWLVGRRRRVSDDPRSFVTAPPR